MRRRSAKFQFVSVLTKADNPNCQLTHCRHPPSHCYLQKQKKRDKKYLNRGKFVFAHKKMMQFVHIL